MSPELYRRARRAEAKADRADDRRRLRLDFFRAALAEGLDSVKVMHAGGASGQESVQAHARVVDDLVKSLTKLITSDTNGLAATPFVVIALGGYGRGELHPSSDIDLMVIYDGELSPYVQRVTQELLYTLWDLGFRSATASARWRIAWRWPARTCPVGPRCRRRASSPATAGSSRASGACWTRTSIGGTSSSSWRRC